MQVFNFSSGEVEAGRSLKNKIESSLRLLGCRSCQSEQKRIPPALGTLPHTTFLNSLPTMSPYPSLQLWQKSPAVSEVTSVRRTPEFQRSHRLLKLQQIHTTELEVLPVTRTRSCSGQKAIVKAEIMGKHADNKDKLRNQYLNL